MKFEINKIEKLLHELAFKSFKKGEIPVSAVVTQGSKIIAKSCNCREKLNDITAHAEILAIKKAAKRLKRWNLNDCDLYVSLKPCQMCYEVIKQSRIQNVYYFLEKPEFKKDYNKTNFVGLNDSKFSCSYQQLLSDFFQNKR